MKKNVESKVASYWKEIFERFSDATLLVSGHIDGDGRMHGDGLFAILHKDEETGIWTCSRIYGIKNILYLKEKTGATIKPFSTEPEECTIRSSQFKKCLPKLDGDKSIFNLADWVYIDPLKFD